MENSLPSDYQNFIALSKYARWLPKEKRRETWEETVRRYIEFFMDRYPGELTEEVVQLQDAILNLEIMPSMRALMTAGPALERDNVAAYNCSYTDIKGRGKEVELFNKEIEDMVGEPIILTLKNPIVFDEFMYILLCGTGAG